MIFVIAYVALVYPVAFGRPDHLQLTATAVVSNKGLDSWPLPRLARGEIMSLRCTFENLLNDSDLFMLRDLFVNEWMKKKQLVPTLCGQTKRFVSLLTQNNTICVPESSAPSTDCGHICGSVRLCYIWVTCHREGAFSRDEVFTPKFLQVQLFCSSHLVSGRLNY